MKTFSLLFVVCMACGLASAQVNGSLAAPQMQSLGMPEHVAHASQTALATEQRLIGSYGTGYAQGERPLWEVMQLAPETPLGDLAREARKDHEIAKKAVKTWTN